MWNREAQKHTGSTDPDPDADPDPEHWWLDKYILRNSFLKNW